MGERGRERAGEREREREGGRKRECVLLIDIRQLLGNIFPF